MAQTNRRAGAQVPVDAISEPVSPAGAGLRTHQQAHQDDHELVRQALSDAAGAPAGMTPTISYPAGKPYTKSV